MNRRVHVDEPGPIGMSITDRKGNDVLTETQRDEARAHSVPIEVGKKYTFVSEVIEEGLADDERLCKRTGQEVTVLRLCGPDENDPENSPLWRVRFPDGHEASAWDEELSGWDLYFGQFYGPSGRWGDPQ